MLFLQVVILKLEAFSYQLTVPNILNPLLIMQLFLQIIPKWLRFLSLGLIAIASVIWLNLGSKPQPAQAVDIPPQPVEISSNWQAASFPVENFQGYSSPFGYRSSPTNPSKQEFHRGLDIAAPVGSYVRNWWSGQVLELSDNTNCGTMIRIQSGAWQHIYCHLSGHVEGSTNGKYLIDREGGIQLWEGQQIAAGTRMARIGMTGRTTGPHLHWGLKYSNDYVDPAIVLQAMYQQQAALVPEQSPV